jgi:hypothetical protein
MQPRCVRRHLQSPLSAQDGRSRRVRPPADPMMNSAIPIDQSFVIPMGFANSSTPSYGPI